MAEDITAENTVEIEDSDAAATDAAASKEALADGESSIEGPKKRSFWNENKIEIITAILLGVTALLTAWASWIGYLHSGIQAINFTKSNNISAEAGTVYDYELQTFIYDNMTWNKIVGVYF